MEFIPRKDDKAISAFVLLYESKEIASRSLH